MRVTIFIGNDYDDKQDDRGDYNLFSTQPPEPEILYDILAENNEDKDEGAFGSDDDL